MTRWKREYRKRVAHYRFWIVPRDWHDWDTAIHATGLLNYMMANA